MGRGFALAGVCCTLNLGCSWPPSSGPELFFVTPSQVPLGKSAAATLHGHGFYNRVGISLDNQGGPSIGGEWALAIGELSVDPATVEWLSTEELAFVIPGALALGSHDLTLTTPRGLQYRLANAVDVATEVGSQAGADAGGPSAPRGASGRGRTNRESGIWGIGEWRRWLQPSNSADSAADDDDSAVADASADAGPGVPTAAAGPAAGCGDCSTVCTFGNPELVTGLGLTPPLYGPSLTSDDGTLFLAALIGRDERIFYATRTAFDARFSTAAEPANLNSNAGQEGTPFISADQSRLYFFSTRAGGLGSRDLWSAPVVSMTPPSFGTAQPLDVNSSRLDHTPTLAQDQLELFFASNRRSTLDLWRATRSAPDAAFSAPELVVELESAGDDTGPHLSADGRTLFFTSNRRRLDGDFDLWYAVRTSPGAPFSQPVPLDLVNSSGGELDPAANAALTELFFSSNRDGQRRLWRATPVCAP